jgi:NAD(P)-dependent dehydrogenase (short-subunit alcohol dehydrogenase family)
VKTHDRVVVIGGGSGMGLEVARKVLAGGAEVVVAGRSGERLHAARTSLGEDRVEIATVDIGERSQMAALFARVGQLNHLVVTAADLPYGPVLEPGGSITFTSGIAARRPMRGGSAAAAINSALEGLVRALAIELAPLRVNAVSPGWTDTPIWDGLAGMTEERKKEAFATMAARLPAGRIGRAEDIAEAVVFLMKSEFSTGTVVEVDGGHRLA